MRVVADAVYAPGVCACAWGSLFGASCVFMCRHLLTFARAWRFVLQWLVSHTPVCSFAIIFEKKTEKKKSKLSTSRTSQERLGHVLWPVPSFL